GVIPSSIERHTAVRLTGHADGRAGSLHLARAYAVSSEWRRLPMAEVRMDAHRTWEDWAGICIGAVTALSPWLTGQTSNGAAVTNAVIVGLIVVAFGILEMVRLHRLEEIALFACGLWLFASPFTYGYGGNLAFVHTVLGALLALLAAFEIWQ